MALDAPRTDGAILNSIEPHLDASADLRVYCSLLFGEEPDGLAQYEPEALAGIARSSFAFAETKPRGRHKIRRHAVTLETASGSQPFTLVEIVNDDMPFLVDSIIGELQARGISALLVLHPILKVRRSGQGGLKRILGPGDSNWGDGTQESWIVLLLDAMTPAAADSLTETLSSVLDDVRVAVTDWQTMTARFDRAIHTLETSPPPIAPGLLSESLAFCRWLVDGQFTFLGLREYRLAGSEETGDLVPMEGSGLGVLRDQGLPVLSRRGAALAMTPEIRSHFFAPHPLVITKSNIMSRVHRRAFMDYVGLKTYKSDGSLAGELRLVGLFTSQAYTQPPQQIPFLRHKIETVIAQSGFAPGSHAAKAIANVLVTFPRDELFQVDEELLLGWARGIIDLDLRPRVRLFARLERFGRYVSVLVFVPRDRFTTSVRERIAAILAEAYGGSVRTFTPFFTEGPLVRVHFIIGRNDGPPPQVSEQDLEARISEATRTWEDQLADAIHKGDEALAALAPKYQAAFPAGYTEMFSASRALEDIARIERLSPERPLAIDFHEEGATGGRRVRAAIYRFDQPIPLSERVPVLENFGFFVIDERSYRVMPRFEEGVREVALHDMVLETATGAPLELALQDMRMEASFLAVCRGEADNDGFNQLVVTAGGDWREAAALRAYAAYLRQIGAPFGMRYVAETLNRHAGMARDLVELFHTRFDPDRDWSSEERARAQERIRQRIEGALAKVPSLDEDRILRHFANLVMATVRTNFFQVGSDGRPPAAIAFKLAPQSVDGLPDPKPYREIWVYSPRVEGVHLRFAPIARGGIRWSDRAQDFRTEVLGLGKAQQVKNTVIVPQGAKGGFVPKQLPRAGSREEIAKEGIAAYRSFVSAMLDITDNIVAGEVVPPARVVRHDGDDPYLVVAADKGTATFSDFANEISLSHEFWLGDAFASGGSAGYDHKRMAITARGAWECVKRHFREMDFDIETQPFRVVGVGDMSGDVFGNGMLLSRAIRLLAAFDHRDIFIDPDPDPETSFAERKRLFDLPRSSWQDYDKSLISKGGGVFSRSVKSIPLSPETRALLAIDVDALTPAELMHAILRCETDLIWFGGIGTYIRASTESHDHVGDRANDAIRVTGLEVRAKVIGEGANLGVTQAGRIELARQGGRINTDFIDNSAGVNSSDQEVNIKIALGPAVASGRLDATARRELLASMTEDVAAACLVNNYQQSLALSLTERSAARDIAYLARLMRALENRGLLDRKLEALPSRQEIAQKQAAGTGLTRPELAVLLSFAKIALSEDLDSSPVPDDPVCEPLLTNYFPAALRDQFLDEIKAHRLRREIVVTGLTNAMLNRGGPAMAVRLADESGRGPGDVASAFITVTAIFHLPDLWHAVDQLDGRMPGEAQLDLYARIQDFLLEQVSNMLRHGMGEGLAATIATHRAGAEELVAILDGCITRHQRGHLTATREALERRGAGPDVAARIATLDILSHATAVTRLAHETDRSIADAARIAFAANDYLRLDELKSLTSALQLRDYYDRLAVNGAIHTLEAARRALSCEILRAAGTDGFDFAAWQERHGGRLARAKAALDEIAATGDVTVSRLTVAAAQVRDLTGA
ncbi:MAG: NAD-glutamate dehydrogenase [Hyphomicrobiaceae bacterium]|nr:NAD-glutamate dehydrogenase [Hyphomicrobiaceae bacterium]